MIDEVFYQVHQRLNEISGCTAKLLFASSPILVCGHLYQFPPVQGTLIYCNTGNMKEIFSLEFWGGSKIAELTEVIGQQGDHEFISLLNKIHDEAVDDKLEKLLASRDVAKHDLFYPKYAVHVLAKSSPVVDYNELILNEIDEQTISLSAIDDIPLEVQLSEKHLETIQVRMI